jgi:hypothetical protein
MNSEHTTPIRRCATGSIDIDYYLLLGRRARSRQAHDAMDSLSATIRRWVSRWLGKIRVQDGTRTQEVS